MLMKTNTGAADDYRVGASGKAAGGGEGRGVPGQWLLVVCHWRELGRGRGSFVSLLFCVMDYERETDAGSIMNPMTIPIG